MSIDKERVEYHLTNSGWIEGEFDNRSLGRFNAPPKPEDSVLTISCVEELHRTGFASFEPSYDHNVSWKSNDKTKIEKLKEQFGELPNWHGFKK